MLSKLSIASLNAIRLTLYSSSIPWFIYRPVRSDAVFNMNGVFDDNAFPYLFIILGLFYEGCYFFHTPHRLLYYSI